MKYVAFLRGIMPTNPNMRNEKLRKVLEDLGFTNVQTVISSGNVIFESSSKNIKALEAQIEKAWPEKLGFKSTTIIRSKEELQNLIKKDPFKGKIHNRETYLLVTFLKDRKHVKGGAVFNAINLDDLHTPDIMQKAEKEYGKEITSRTWKTVERILARM